MNTLIEKRWHDISKLVVPQEISAAISAQNDECAKVLRSKHAVIVEFEDELKAKVSIHPTIFIIFIVVDTPLRLIRSLLAVFFARRVERRLHRDAEGAGRRH